jgi:hypothetical protein
VAPASRWLSSWVRANTPAAARAAAGMVTTQATVWVVDTGAPSAVEPNRATAAPVSAAIPGPAAAR